MSHRKQAFILGAALALAAAGAVAGPGHGIHWIDDGAERIDLSELADGETRTFGSGGHEVRATRDGDRITLAFDEDGPVRKVVCSVEAEDCSIFTLDDGKVVVMKTAGDGDHEARADVLMLGEEAEGSVFFLSSEGDAGGAVAVHVDENGGPVHWVSGHGDGEAAAVVRLESLIGTVLRCPEGDTTMRLAPEDKDAGPYRCPRHDLELKKVDPKQAHGGVMVLRERVDER